jgi:hypothetical protein
LGVSTDILTESRWIRRHYFDRDRYFEPMSKARKGFPSPLTPKDFEFFYAPIFRALKSTPD